MSSAEINGSDVAWHSSVGELDTAVSTTPIEEIALRVKSPRSGDENKTHVTVLAAADYLPPIIVHRETMRVVDGMHRLAAAKLRGQKTIGVQFFSGTHDDAFVFAVAANALHGLPLSLKERRDAAVQILLIYPQWSDRRIAETAGLSHRTVAALRRSSGQFAQSNTRLGRDGKVRPLAGARGRRIAARLIRANDRAPLREIAQQSGISVSTAQDVRSRLQRGLDPVDTGRLVDCLVDVDRDLAPVLDTEAHGRSGAATNGAALHVVPADDAPASLAEDPARKNPSRRSPPDKSLSAGDMLQRLRTNPSLRFSQDGKTLIRLLSASLGAVRECERLTSTAPTHCRDMVADIALEISDFWRHCSTRIREEIAIRR